MRSISIRPQERGRTPGVFERGDLIGLALVAVAVLWTFAAATSGGDPWPMVGMFVLVGATYAFGRMVTPAALFFVPALVVTVAIVLGLLTLAGALPEGADAPPLGYVNARSAYFVVAAAAAVMLALLVRGRGGRVACMGLAAVLAFVPIFSRSAAASFVVVLLPAAAAIALEGRRLAIAVGLSAVLLMATLAATSLVAAAPGSEPAGLIGEVVGKRRVALWHDGLDLMVQEPLTGIGPGRFATESPTAQTDRDARWAHHGFLHQGAETGLVGLGLLVLLFLWGFWRLALAGPSGMTVMGAFALGALGILACSDYVLHFPLVVGVTSALAGSAVGSSRARTRPSSMVGGDVHLQRRSRMSAVSSSAGTGRLSPHRPLNVLYLIDSLGGGGSERSLAELLGPLAGNGIRPMIATFYRRDGVERQVLEAGFDVRFLGSKTRLGRVRAVRGLLALERPDILHTTLFNSDLAGRVGAAGVGVPVVTSLVNTSYDPVRLQDPNVRAMRLRLLRMVDSWTARYLTTHFHAVTRAVKNAAVRDLGIPPERITVIERGRDPDRLVVPDRGRRDQARKRLGLSPEDDVLLSVGRQEFQKGHRYLIEAMVELSRVRPNAILLIAGPKGHASEELERLWRETELGDRVRFLGFVEDIPGVLAAADLFVFPSLYEGLPGALIEAMAVGLPIVASDIDATREVLEPGRNAILVPSASPSPLAGAVLRLLSEEATRGEFGARSRHIFKERFTLEVSVRRMVAMYESVVRGRNWEIR